MKKIRIIIQKEWAEVFKNRLIISTIIFMPLLFSALPLIILGFMPGDDGSVDAQLTTELPAQFAQFCGEELTASECYKVFMVNQFMLLFMMTPLIIPVNIAAYSIVGEKTTRSLEPLLATPITTAELLAGKNLAAAIPAVLGSWLGFFVFLGGALILSGSPQVVRALTDPMWWLAIFVAGPLLAILSVNFSIMVSSRVNDPRVAEQLSAVVILPILGLFFGQISGLLLVNSRLILIMALLLALVDIAMVYVAVRIFQREVILTRWK
jgi:ABC-2 type transport system permease protein